MVVGGIFGGEFLFIDFMDILKNGELNFKRLFFYSVRAYFGRNLDTEFPMALEFMVIKRV
jgi:hypothetical protein